MQYRAENKYIVTDSELAVLSARLSRVMRRDSFHPGGRYEISSLYFDDLSDGCMDENEAGLDQREKFRIRIYESSLDTIHLEIKEKLRGFTAKSSCDITRRELEQIMSGTLPLAPDGRAPLNRLKAKQRLCGMAPKAIIRYDRTAFTYPSGNVRVTFDRNIMASPHIAEFGSPRVSGMVSVLPTGTHVLEVKYDEFLPDIIADRLETGTLRQTAFSKYYLGRLAINGEFPVED